MPKKTTYSVVKNNKTPNGPISVGDEMFSIRIRRMRPRTLMPMIIRLELVPELSIDFINLIIARYPPSFWSFICCFRGLMSTIWEGDVKDYPALKS